MGNPFKEADNLTAQPNVKPASEPAPKAKTKPAAEKKPESGKKSQQGREAASEKKEQSISANALLKNKLKKKKTMSTHAFYIDDDVYAEIERLARENESTASPTLNALLRAVLFNE